MKKILLTILAIFCIFQMIVLAVDIDIGSAAIDRASGGGTQTYINANNPANLSGIINTIEIWANTDLANCEVATFFVVSGNNLSTRDTHAIGSVTAGAKRTFSGLDITVEAGDYLGMYFSAGAIEEDSSGAGQWFKAGDQIPCTNVLFSWQTTKTISLYGTGATVGWSHKWNTQTISKWNTKEFTKWNDLE